MRKLATVRKVDVIKPIEGADAIELAVFGGWQVVIKKGEYSPGDLAVYCEIDSWIPVEVAPFLVKGEAKEYNGVKGERLKTVKLRGALSQGLALPLSVLKNPAVLDDDVTEQLGIQKWESPVAMSLAGDAKGSFPGTIEKTDQERIQNLASQLDELSENDWEITEKLDGTSCTFYLAHDGEFHVCSRNLSLKEKEGNVYWAMARKYRVEESMRENGLVGVALQGEIIGPGIQGGRYKLNEPEFFLFEVQNEGGHKYPHRERVALCDELGLKHVPILGIVRNAEMSIDGLLSQAEGKSVVFNGCEREGLVYKSLSNPRLSFKAISNKFLLKGGN